MKIQVLSDLHREWGYRKNELPFTPAGDIVVLAGDICTSKTKELVGKEFGECKVPVLYVLGNHDYYGGNWDAELKWAREFHKDPIRVLENDVFRLDGVTFIGTTLWPNVSIPDEVAISRMISDFQVNRYTGGGIIGGFTVGRCRDANRAAREYLEIVLEQERELNPDNKVVVISHFPPTLRVQEERFKGNSLTSYFYNDCDDIIHRFQPDVWIYGHTHANIEQLMGKTRIVANQFGYLNREESSGFRKDYTIEV